MVHIYMYMHITGRTYMQCIKFSLFLHLELISFLRIHVYIYYYLKSTCNLCQWSLLHFFQKKNNKNPTEIRVHNPQMYCFDWFQFCCLRPNKGLQWTAFRSVTYPIVFAALVYSPVICYWAYFVTWLLSDRITSVVPILPYAPTSIHSQMFNLVKYWFLESSNGL